MVKYSVRTPLEIAFAARQQRRTLDWKLVFEDDSDSMILTWAMLRRRLEKS